MTKILKFFNESNQFWSDDRHYNLSFLEQRLNHCKDLFRCRGYLLLSEVYDMFGLAITEKSLTYGWTTNKTESIDIVLLPEIGTNNIMIICIDCYDIKDYFTEEGEAE